MTPERSKAVVNQRLELRATKTTTRDLGSCIVYMICYCCGATTDWKVRGPSKVSSLKPVTIKGKVWTACSHFTWLTEERKAEIIKLRDEVMISKHLERRRRKKETHLNQPSLLFLLTG